MTAQAHDDPPTVFEESSWLAQISPDFEAARRRLSGVVWSTPSGHLPPSMREIVAVVLLAYRAHPSVETHMRRALAAGARFRELVEALQVASVPGGHPCLHFALPYLKALRDELGDRADDAGDVAAASTEREPGSEWEWMRQTYPEYEAVRDALKDQMWTPANPVLAVKYREIVAAVVLACRPYPTATRHLRRAISEGATLLELVEAMETAALIGGLPVLDFTLPDLIAIGDELESGAPR